MADITDHTDPGLPSELEDTQTLTNGDVRGVKRARAADDDDDDDEKGGRERRKIEIKFIKDKSRRHITFSKRKAGIMKKAYELSVLTGTQVLLLVVSETGLVYTFTTPKLQPLVTKAEGKNLIQACLNAPEPSSTENGGDEANQADSPEESPASQHLPPNARPAIPQQGQYPPSYMPAIDPNQAMAYQNYVQQRSTTYGMPPQTPMSQHPPHQS
ncbi:transcription factor of the MADS box [Ceratocystis pirilliformis]|uniref:Transcription factor of the MADS box n=1 Tax=Ceratocystis pirilliformis TaxID=259994 RepID=A0ABR3Z8D2_9PEZI